VDLVTHFLLQYISILLIWSCTMHSGVSELASIWKRSFAFSSPGMKWVCISLLCVGINLLLYLWTPRCFDTVIFCPSMVLGHSVVWHWPCRQGAAFGMCEDTYLTDTSLLKYYFFKLCLCVLCTLLNALYWKWNP